MHAPSRGAAAPLRLSHVALSAVLAGLADANAAVAAPLNLAPRGLATASSEDFGAVAADGNDGVRNGAFDAGWVFHTRDPDLAAFYQVDLQGSYHVVRVQIFPRTDVRQGSVENFRVTVLADDGAGNPGAAVFTRDYFPTGAANFTFGTTDPGGARGRFVRIDRLDGTPPFLTFAELEVYGQNTPLGTNVALGKTVNASAPGFGATLAGGNDGNIGGDFYQGNFPVYHSAAQGVGHFYEIDLGERVDIDYLELFDRGDADTTTQFRVAVLDENLVQVYETFVDSVGLLTYDHLLDLTGVAGRYVRLETTQNEFLAFSELRVIAVPEPGAAALLTYCGIPLLARRRRNARHTSRPM